MRNRYQRIHCVLHFVGNLLIILGPIILLPLIVVALYWGQRGDEVFLISSGEDIKAAADFLTTT